MAKSFQISFRNPLDSEQLLLLFLTKRLSQDTWGDSIIYIEIVVSYNYAYNQTDNSFLC